ncbi:MAG TPA: AMP-binding protein, partial [Terricaulis sp.]|nr:AMP-binding protein [Terricaulis sp.]
MDNAESFRPLSDMIAAHAAARPDAAALIQDEARLSYAALNARMDRIAATLQREGVNPGEAIAICAGTSLEYA